MYLFRRPSFFAYRRSGTPGWPITYAFCSTFPLIFSLYTIFRLGPMISLLFIVYMYSATTEIDTSLFVCSVKWV